MISRNASNDSNAKVTNHMERMREKIIVAAVSLLAVSSLLVSGSLASPGKKSVRLRSNPARVSGNDLPKTRGFLFLNAEYVPPPYLIQLVNDSTASINGQELHADELDLSCYDEELRQGGHPEPFSQPPAHFDRATPTTAIPLLCRDIEVLLRLDSVVVLARNFPPLMLDEADDGEAAIASLCVDSQRDCSKMNFSPAATEATWNALVRDFRAPPAFRSRATLHLAKLDQLERTGIRVMTANLMVDALGYPLHTFAMLMVVLAFGHLLSNKPCVEQVGNESQQMVHTRRVVTRSLILFGVLSAIDLFWTVASSQAGVLREMNPLGSAMIHNPMILGLFKIAAVATTITLLMRLHTSPAAQIASWWSCLVLTLLTARWLVFQSMLM